MAELILMEHTILTRSRARKTPSHRNQAKPKMGDKERPRRSSIGKNKCGHIPAGDTPASLYEWRQRIRPDSRPLRGLFAALGSFGFFFLL